MQAFILDFVNFMLRWLHVIAAIAWIGESIYFVMLDNSLRKPKSANCIKKGVAGEMWAVHGGGFYHNQKYASSPEDLPEDLHWSFWKAYTTWLSGFALFIILYMAQPSFYLVNPNSSWAWAAELTGWQANGLALIFLLMGWVIYNELCKRISPNMDRDGLLSIAVGVLVVAVAYLSTQLFAGRAAFLLTGAVMATAMSANVFFWIIPGQRRIVKAMKAGEAPNPLDGKRGKQRSVHNTYFTLPVVLLMISNHYAFSYTHDQAWIIMALLIFGGAVIRQFFVLMHAGKTQPGYLVAGAAFILAAFWVSAPPFDEADSSGSAQAVEAGPGAATLADVSAVMSQHCVVCHAEEPTYPGITAAPAGQMFETDAQITGQAAKIKEVVASKYMPLGNVTQMTEAEREIIANWDE
ncbi:MAG: urate hydroxylase PuuD [Marinobacter sp.]|uniref:urate hydroxylase PuuD n=1 Tax=Marinobacter sp. TaxID=50741 RepID=UPI003F988078